ncbi:hypothetical protein C0995_001713 [Termitomyces sp. Mi166|nr:hypothetical protein C0995_001713 [Termitomyces sp. Mi166\
MFSILWAIHANVMELTTWVMCHIVTDKDIYSRVCQEIRNFVNQQFPRIDSITRIDPKVLEDDAFRFLNSVIQEVMRTKTAVGPMRVATMDAVIMDEDDKEIFIRKGEMIFINFPGMHHSPSLQEEPEVFKADRFINGSPYKSYMFGGGKHICAGRNYAKFVVRQFIIMTLALNDIQLQTNTVDGSGSLPESDGTMGLKLMLFSRRKNDLLITLDPVSTSASLAK